MNVTAPWSYCDIFMNYIYKTEGEAYGAAISWDLDWFVLNAEASARVRAGKNAPEPTIDDLTTDVYASEVG